ncbi:hypothetical protein BDV98DRAFT_510045 [Pterulicium gracile]|uniref:CCHC-type domain-containing protein n=1 Tax=Pterulicium gracile TaxID=1884261 RepID=A0A5C3QCQ5_9AGAR|nr:hypothetical protein BDV98DRAFT_510045 [Pterula gracilis]
MQTQLANNAATVPAQVTTTPAPAPSIDHNGRAAVAQPPPYMGVYGLQARRFRSAFFSYAFLSGHALNTWDATGTGAAKWKPDGLRWIGSFLSLCQGPAALWASVHQEALASHIQHLGSANAAQFPAPFSGLYVELIKSFTLRWEPGDVVATAKAELLTLFHLNMRVSEYAAKFQELCVVISRSDEDNRDRFLEHLGGKIKDFLIHVPDDRKDTLDKLIAESIHIDERFRLRAEEEVRDCALFGRNPAPAYNAPAARVFVPFVAPTPCVAAPDPNAMQVDHIAAARAQPQRDGRTPEQFRQWLAGRCYGCGSAEHRAAEGGHARKICRNCGKNGHREPVCMSKFLGRPVRACVAATAEGLLPLPTAAVVDAVPALEDAQARIAQLQDQIALLRAQTAPAPAAQGF